MKLYICGSRAFGLAIFALARDHGHEVVGVAAPFAVGGTDRLYRAAEAIGLRPCTTDFGARDVPDGTDLILCAHAHVFVDAATRARARAGAIGYHPSLLPLHRGRDAIRWAIAMRERVTGGSVYHLTDQVDAGPIVVQRHVLIRPTDDAAELWARALMPLGVELMAEALAGAASADDAGPGYLEAWGAMGEAQREELATWEPSWSRSPLRRPE